VGVAAWQPFVLAPVLLFARVLVIVQIAPEEIALRDRFGTSYGDYSKQVNRWIGRKSRSNKPPGGMNIGSQYEVRHVN